MLFGGKKNSGYVFIDIRGDVKILTFKPDINHKRSSVRSHTLAPTSICDLSHSLCWSPLTDLGHISSVTYACHPLWFVCGHRKGILTSPLRSTYFGEKDFCTGLNLLPTMRPKKRHPCLDNSNLLC